MDQSSGQASRERRIRLTRTKRAFAGIIFFKTWWIHLPWMRGHNRRRIIAVCDSGGRRTLHRIRLDSLLEGKRLPCEDRQG
jgi:hypothetical protein